MQVGGYAARRRIAIGHVTLRLLVVRCFFVGCSRILCHSAYDISTMVLLMP